VIIGATLFTGGAGAAILALIVALGAINKLESR
jgi:hypothetical protein